MRKILTIVSLLSLVSFNANAIDRSDISATLGISANSAVYGASAKETNREEDNTIKTPRSESGVFTDGHKSGFIELNLGEFISLGYEHTPDSITTPEADRVTNTNAKTTVSVDFNDLNIAYFKLNTPFGVYGKYGFVSTDLDIKESMASGSTYENVSTDGTIMGIGYAKAIRDSRIGIRIEGTYMELDDVTSSNGVSATGGSSANGGRNQIDASNLEGLNAKVALTFTLGQ